MAPTAALSTTVGRRRHAKLTAAACLILVVAGACQNHGKHPGFTHLRVGQAAPPFNVVGTHETISSQDLEGHGRILVLAFLSPRCPHCAQDVHAVAGVAPKVIGPAGAHVAVVVIDDRGHPGASAMSAFAKANGSGIGPLFASDPGGVAWRAFRVTRTGSVFIIGTDGRLEWQRLDPTLAALRDAVRRALQHS